MRKFAFVLLLLAPLAAAAQTPARFDLPTVTTTPAQVPVGSLPNLLAVTNATVSVCQFPAVLSGGAGSHTMCTNTITAYTDSTLSTACPSTAQLTVNGTSVCIPTTGLQGSFGFWYNSATQTHMTYTIQTKWGIFGPYDILQGGGGGGGGSGVSNFTSGNLAPLFTTNVANGTTTPAQTYTASTFGAHSFYGNNSASTGTPAASFLGTSDWSPNAYVVGSGSAQVQTITLAPAATALVAGLEVRWLPIAANTAAQPTLNVNGLGAKVITKLGTTALMPNDLTTLAVADAIYDGTRWQLQNPQTSGGGSSSFAIGLDFGGTKISDSATAPSSGDCLGYDGTNILGVSCGGGGTPAGSNGNPQINASGSFGAAANIFYQQSGDTISSIETECSSLCTYVVSSPQTITLGSSHALSATVWVQFTANGSWTVNGSGFTLSNVQVSTSTLTTHFPAGSGSVSLGISNTLVPVEWFGAVSYSTFAAAVSGTDSLAAIQGCLNAISVGQCLVQAQYYRTTAAITITKSYVGLQGPPTARVGGGIVLTSATGDILDLTGTSGTYLTFNVFRNLSLYRSTPDTGSDAGFHGSFAGGTLVEYVNSTDSLYPFFLHAMPSFGNGGMFHDVTDWCENGLTRPTGTPIGFRLDSTDGVAENSLLIRDSGTANSCGSNIGIVAMELIGTSVNDVNTFFFHSSLAAYGQIVTVTGSAFSASQSDIHFIHSVHDQFYNSAFQFNSVTAASAGAITVENARVSTANSTTYGVDCESSSGIGIFTSQFLGKTLQYGAYFNGCSNPALTGNMFQDASGSTSGDVDIKFMNTNGGTITGNSLNHTSTSVGFDGIRIDGTSANNTITGNALSGYYGEWGIFSNSSTANNTFVGNAIDSTHMTTGSIGTNGTGNTTFNGGANSVRASVDDSADVSTARPAYRAIGILNVAGWKDTTPTFAWNLGFAIPAGTAGANPIFSFIKAGTWSEGWHLDSTSGMMVVDNALSAPSFSSGTSNNFNVDTSGNYSTAAVAAATSSANVNSPFAKFISNYWTGSVSATDSWSIFTNVTAPGGTNPVSTLTFAHSGSSGGGVVNIPSLAAASFNGVNVTVGSGGFVSLIANGTATSGANFNSATSIWQDGYWNGTTGTTSDYNLQLVDGTGANPSQTWKLTRTGPGSGAQLIDFSVEPIKLADITTPSLNGVTLITNIQITLPTSSISANTCTTPATATMTGLATTSAFATAFATNPNAVTGWGATGGLTFTAWPTANTLNWSVCNATASPITPGAMTLNVGAR